MRRNASSALSWATRAKSLTPRRSRISARFSLPAPEHKGHSIVSVGDRDRIGIFPSWWVCGGVATTVLLLVLDQQTRIGSVTGDQDSTLIACSTEPFASAPGA